MVSKRPLKDMVASAAKECSGRESSFECGFPVVWEEVVQVGRRLLRRDPSSLVHQYPKFASKEIGSAL